MLMRPFHVMGEFAFVIGIALAIVMGVFFESLNGFTMSIIFITLGVIVGLMSVTDRESDRFLIASIALLIAGAAGLQTLPVLGDAIGAVFTNVITFVAPAAMIVAIKSIYSTASSGIGFIYHVIKRDGTLQVFMKDKVATSCTKAGASRATAEAVANDVAGKITSGMTTRHIAELVKDSLVRMDRKAASSYEKQMKKKK